VAEWNGTFAPPMDVVEEEGRILVRAEIPGMKPEDIDVSITGDTVTIRGEKKFEKKEKREDFLRQERSFGTFVRTLTLPMHVRAEKAEAKYENGILELRLDKSEKSRTQKITVK